MIANSKQVFVALFSLLVAGCSTLEGVNVGAHVPIGGVVGVGVSTTVSRPERVPEEPGTTPSSEPCREQDSDCAPADEEED